MKTTSAKNLSVLISFNLRLECYPSDEQGELANFSLSSPVSPKPKSIVSSYIIRTNPFTKIKTFFRHYYHFPIYENRTESSIIKGRLQKRGE